MFPIGLIRKLGKFVRGGVTPGQALLGCLLGVLLGMVPGVNLTLVIVVLLLVLLNANGGLAILGFAMGKALCMLLAPVTFEIGYFLVHRIGLEGLFRAAADTPVVALMDLHYYCLLGGLPVALVVGLVYGLVMGNVLKGIRKGILAAGDRSDRAKRIGENRFARGLLRVVFGRTRGTMAELLERKSPLIRTSGVIVCVVVVLLAAGLQLLLVDLFLTDALRFGMEAAVGAEVNVEKADLSLTSSRLTVTGLQVTDPEKPTHNLFAAGELCGDISVLGLLTKRVVLDELTVAGAVTDAKRPAPGKVYEKPPRPEPELPEGTLSEYFEKARKLREYFRKLRDYLKDRDPNEPEPTPEERRRERQRLRDLAKAQGYFRLSARGILARRPSWVIRKLDVQGLRIEHVEGPVRVQGRELSDAPEVHDEPMELIVTEGAKTLADVRLNFATPGGEHRLSLHTPPLPMGEAFRLSEKSGLDVSDGTAQVDVEKGVFTSRQYRRFPFQVTVRDLKAGAREGRGVLGLDPQTTREALKHLTEIRLAGVLDGRIEAPRVKLDESAALTALKDTLVKAGKAELARRADAQLQKLGAELTGKLGSQVGKTVQDAAGGLLKGLPGLGTPKDPNDAKAKDPNDEKKPAGGLLDSLLKK